MHWIVFAAGAAVAMASADLCIKLAAGKLSNSLGLLIYGSCTFLAGLTWVLWQRFQGVEFQVQPQGLWAAVGVGLSFSLVTAGLYFTFGAGAPVSLASPMVRLGGLILASLIGITAFGEPFTWRMALGALMCGGGVYLVVTR